jgi:hypothetical protein
LFAGASLKCRVFERAPKSAQDLLLGLSKLAIIEVTAKKNREVAQDFPGAGIMAGRAGDAASRMASRAAQMEAGDLTPIIHMARDAPFTPLPMTLIVSNNCNFC